MKKKVVKNVLESSHGYSLSGYRWSSLSVTYSFMPDGTVIGTQKSDLWKKYSPVELMGVVGRGFEVWGRYVPLVFEEVGDDGSPVGSKGKFGDIRIGSFASGGNQYAQSYFPYATSTRGGDITLNTRYEWYRLPVLGTGKYADLYSVMLHEIGHALGLGHSTKYGCVMWPYIVGVYTDLKADDVAGIQAIYGVR